MSDNLPDIYHHDKFYALNIFQSENMGNQKIIGESLKQITINNLITFAHEIDIKK